MSRFTVRFNEPKEIMGYSVDKVSYGLDHAVGYFVTGFLAGEVVFDRDSYGFGLTTNPDSTIPMTNIELSTILRDIGHDVDADLVAIDLPPTGE